MTWKKVVGYPEYEISSSGLVKRVIKYNRIGLLKPQYDGRKRYKFIGLCRKNKSRFFLLHRLVAEAFLGPRPDGYQINHKDGDKENNCVKNLEYVTHKENVDHAIKHGLISCGEDHYRSKLTNENVLRIKKIRSESKLPYYKLADMFGVTTMAIFKIVNNQNWKHLRGQE